MLIAFVIFFNKFMGFLFAKLRKMHEISKQSFPTPARLHVH